MRSRSHITSLCGVRVCVCVCVCACTYVCVCVCVYVSECVCVFLFVYRVFLLHVLVLFTQNRILKLPNPNYYYLLRPCYSLESSNKVGNPSDFSFLNFEINPIVHHPSSIHQKPKQFKRSRTKCWCWWCVDDDVVVCRRIFLLLTTNRYFILMVRCRCFITRSNFIRKHSNWGQKQPCVNYYQPLSAYYIK